MRRPGFGGRSLLSSVPRERHDQTATDSTGVILEEGPTGTRTPLRGVVDAPNVKAVAEFLGLFTEPVAFIASGEMAVDRRRLVHPRHESPRARAADPPERSLWYAVSWAQGIKPVPGE